MSDLISRQDAIHAIGEAIHSEPSWNHTGLRIAGARIKELPSVQPDLSGYSDRLWKAAYERGKAEAQRTGEWIDSHGHTTIDGHDMSELFIRCSECGHDYPDLKDMRFCPNCGCRMTEEKA